MNQNRPIYSIVTYSAQADPALRRRHLWFAAHVLLYLLVTVPLMLLFPLSPAAIVLRALMLVLVYTHFASLFVVESPPLKLEALPVPVSASPPRPLLADGQGRSDDLLDHDRLWYRWHDV